MEGEVALRAQTALSSLSPRLFGGSGEAAVSVVEGSLTMTIDYTSGPFTGKQVIAVGDDSVSASGNVKIRSV